MSSGEPLVGIGLPVWNGARWIAQTVESIQHQTLQDWELVIVDNSSTDDTLGICQRLQREDSRIRVFANSRNIGVSGNYNRVFELSRGRYFKWAACADLIAPNYLECCVQQLEAAPDAVLCHSRTVMIDECGRLLPGYDDGFALEDPSPSRRFFDYLSRNARNNSVHAVIRRQTLMATHLMQGFRQDDIVLVAELALRGRFLLVDRPLFYRRQTTETDTQRMTSEQIDHYFAPHKHVLHWQKWRWHWALARIAASSTTSNADRVPALARVAKMAWWARIELTDEVRDAWYPRSAPSAQRPPV